MAETHHPAADKMPSAAAEEASDPNFMTSLARGLSAAMNQPIGQTKFGVFRM